MPASARRYDATHRNADFGRLRPVGLGTKLPPIVELRPCFRCTAKKKAAVSMPSGSSFWGCRLLAFAESIFLHFFVPREGGCSGLPDPNFGFTESDHVAELKGIRGLNPARKIEDT
jgi:hypothetical protein